MVGKTERNKYYAESDLISYVYLTQMVGRRKYILRHLNDILNLNKDRDLLKETITNVLRSPLRNRKIKPQILAVVIYLGFAKTTQ